MTTDDLNEAESSNGTASCAVSRAVPCSAVVTRYPSGVLGLDYRGSLFWWWCFNLDEMLSKIDSLDIPRQSVRWQERYFDGDYRIAENYKTRAWIPRNSELSQPGTQITE